MGACSSCCRKKRRYLEPPPPIPIGTIIKDRWQLTRFIAGGGFGYVYEVSDIKTQNSSNSERRFFALKIELLNEDKECHLPTEFVVISKIRELGVKQHFAEIFDKNSLSASEIPIPCVSAQYLVMTLLGPSLVALADLCPKSAFSSTTMANIAKQTIEALQFLHNAGFLHRDIKPANFVTGLGAQKHEIFMVDYGFARRFLDDDGKRLPPRVRAPFRGTSPYASINTYECKEQAPADDLWSLFYMVVDLRTGTLPWSKVTRSSAVNDIKKHILPKEWLVNIEPEYTTFHDYLTSLHFDMSINYPYLNDLFDKILTREKVTMLSPLDWESGSSVYNKIDKTKLAKLFKER